MPRFPFRLPVLVMLLGLPMLRAAGSPAHVDDPQGLLPPDPPSAPSLEAKLAGFERASGLKVLVRFQAKSPSAEEDKVDGAYMHALATRLGTVRRGALAVYFADEDDWRVWIGDESTPGFVGQPGTAEAFTKSGLMHAKKEALLTATRAAGDARFAALQKAAPPGHPPAPARRMALEADALLDGLIGKLSAH